MNLDWTAVPAARAHAHRHHGVRGWLFFFAAANVLGLLLTAGLIAIRLQVMGLTVEDLRSLHTPVVAFLKVALAVQTVTVLIVLGLMVVRSPRFRTLSSVLYVGAALLMCLPVVLNPFPGVWETVVETVLPWWIFCALSIPYLQRSRRVRVTFEHLVHVDEPGPSPRGPGTPQVPPMAGSADWGDWSTRGPGPTASAPPHQMPPGPIPAGSPGVSPVAVPPIASEPSVLSIPPLASVPPMASGQTAQTGRMGAGPSVRSASPAEASRHRHAAPMPARPPVSGPPPAIAPIPIPMPASASASGTPTSPAFTHGPTPVPTPAQSAQSPAPARAQAPSPGTDSGPPASRMPAMPVAPRPDPAAAPSDMPAPRDAAGSVPIPAWVGRRRHEPLGPDEADFGLGVLPDIPPRVERRPLGDPPTTAPAPDPTRQPASGSGEKPAERVGARPGERAGERVGERSGERSGERTGERAGTGAGERVGAERAGEETPASAADEGLPPPSWPADESFWALALEEVEGPGRRAGLWARSFAGAGGDEVRAKVAYLNTRVAELSQAHKVAQQAELAARRAEAEAATRAREIARFQTFELPSRGRCPRCGTVQPMTSPRCPGCGADFGTGALTALIVER